MKKSKSHNRPKSKKHTGASSAAPAKANRRSFLSKAATIAGAVVLVGGVGIWGVRSVQASMVERDLTQIGQGKPAIVQVHDAQCPTCVALQREVRAAFKDLEADVLDYRIADIKTDEGLLFASLYGAVHSTLLFFDDNGQMVGRLVGANDRSTLARAFADHIAR